MEIIQNNSEEFLRHCFKALSKFSYDKLKEILEREKENTETQSSLLWSSFLHLIITFAELEKSFYSLAFMDNSSNFGSRWLAKREQTLKMRYNCLNSELKKIETVHQDLISISSCQQFPSQQNLKQLINNVSGQLQHFVIARMNIISFYEQLPSLINSKNVNVEDLFKIINSTLEEFLLKNFLPIVAEFKEIYRMECEAVLNLLKMQIHLQKCQYLESVISFVSSSKYLSMWSNILFLKEGRRHAFGNSSHRSGAFELYEWLNKFKGLLMSKFNLYFYDVLCQNGGNPNEVRNNTAKAPIDFYSKITSIYRKADAFKILLVLTNMNELEESSRRRGYFLPSKIEGSILNTRSEAPEMSGSRQNSALSSLLSSSESQQPSKTVIFEYPSDKNQLTSGHIPTLFNLLDSKQSELEHSDKIVSAVDEASQYLYVMMRIEGSIHLVTITKKKSFRVGSNLINFYNSFSADLKCNTLFTSFRQGSK